MKNLKLLPIAFFIICALLTIFGTTTYAVDTMKLNITDIRPYTSSKYVVLTPGGNENTIFKIGKRVDTELNYKDSLYCLRAGLGFGNSEVINDLSELGDVTYSKAYNLKKDAEDVMSYYSRTIGYDIDEDTYNSILWVIDNMYLPEHPDAAELKEKLLKDAEISITGLEEEDIINDDDIEFVQQMVLWYFSNYDTNGENGSLSLEFNPSNSLVARTKINEENLSADSPRAVAMDKLYKYFIENAVANKDIYKISKEKEYTKPTINIDDSLKEVVQSGGFTTIGPFSISETTGTVDYSVVFKVEDKNNKEIPAKNSGLPVYYIMENEDDITPCADSLNEMIGEGEFYLKISDLYREEFDLDDVNIVPTLTYDKFYKTTATLWTASAEDQPVLKVEKEAVVEGNFKIVINKVDEDENSLLNSRFALALEDRTPVILFDNNNGTFTTDDIAITENGQIFIYDIDEIQTPNGYIGLENPFRIKVTTKLSLDGEKYIIDTINTTFIDESTGEPLDIVENVTLTVTDNVISIEVKNEKIRIFDLALRKNITKVNGEAIDNTKEPAIDTNPLVTAGSTTAEYAHRKDPVEVKPGDKVTYKISAYNEGDIKGAVTKIVDYLPEGLVFDAESNPEFIAYKESYEEGETTGKKYTYKYDETTRTLTIEAIEGNIFELEAFDGENLDSDSIEVVCKVTATGGNTDKILTNIATMEYKSIETGYEDVTDRDSSNNNVNLPGDRESYKGSEDNKDDLTDEDYFYEGQEDDDDFDKIVIKGVYFDLALRKNITKVNGEVINNTKDPVIDISKLNTYGSATGEKVTTAEYAHRKDPVEVKPGDKVTYKISAYNEGDIKGAVTKIVDYLPEGLVFDAESNPEFIAYKESYEEGETTGKKYTYKYDETTRTLTIEAIEGNIFELEAFDGENLDSDSIEVVCKVTATGGNTDKILTNIATMEYKSIETGYEDVTDRDSSNNNVNLPEDRESYKGSEDNKDDLTDKDYFYEGQEDDDDFDKIVIKGVQFDLALRKFITKVNEKEITTRIPMVDTSKLNTRDNTGKEITTATYTHSKEPVTVKQGDIVTYTLRVYNEGEVDGYASKIVDYIPEGLGYIIDYKANTENFWVGITDDKTNVIPLVGENGLYSSESAVKNLKVEDFSTAESLKDVNILTGNARVYTDKLSDSYSNIIKAYNPEMVESNVLAIDNWQKSANGNDGLYYNEVEITCIVLEENTFNGTLRNIAEIMDDKAINENGDELDIPDRDSIPENVDDDQYNPPADNSSYQEDDDDYELLELKYFDLALRKFITQVETLNGEKNEITTRIPKPKLNSNSELEYEHDKTPVYVANSDIVTYTIRVYNEGTVLGYATEIADDIPDGLVFLPENDTNKEYNWKMYDKDGKETDDPTLAVEIRTDYLKNSLLNSFDATKNISETEPFNPDYADVKVVFQVIEENITAEDRIVINEAQITEDKAVDEDGNEIDIDDEDSIPNEWNEGEDDQDIEKIYVKKFDLALLKWVTKSIVEVDGKTTTTETGFTPYDVPEPIAKVVIDKKKINKTTVKFAYNIIITNQGEIEGYATEITDYIPEGLEFVEEDNPIWKKAGDNKITTNALEQTLLKPGETATVEVIFRWKQSSENLGVKTNIAEISEDYNEKGAKDIDSVPDNVITDKYEEQQEDDDDKALVMLELKTGGAKSYLWLVLVVLVIIGGGTMLIKKFVL